MKTKAYIVYKRAIKKRRYELLQKYMNYYKKKKNEKYERKIRIIAQMQE